MSERTTTESLDFPSKRARSTSPADTSAAEGEDSKTSRKREREISLEPAFIPNGDLKQRKDSLVPTKKNRTSLDSPVAEDDDAGSSGSLSPTGSPRSPPRDVKIKVRQISQGVEDMRWQQIKQAEAHPNMDTTQDPSDRSNESLDAAVTGEKGVKRKFLERGTSQGPNELEGTPEPSKEPQKRPRDDPEKDDNPRTTKRPSPPPESKPSAPRTARSPPPSPKRVPVKSSSGFSAYSGIKSPFSKVKGPSIFGSSPAPSTFAPPSSSSPAASPFASSSSTPSNETPPSTTPAKRSGFEAFASVSPFASASRSKSPVFGKSSSRATSPSRRGTPTTNSSAFSTWASGGAKGFAQPSSKRARADSPERDTSEGHAVVESSSKIFNGEAEHGSFGAKLRAGKDEDAEEIEEEGKPTLTEQEISTGEEDENTVHQVRGKLFSLVDGQWKEKGTGQLKLNVSNDGSSARLVMRKEAVYNLLLNVTLFPGMKCTLMQDPRYLRFSALEDGHAVHYNLKVSNQKIAQELLEEITNHTPPSS